MTPRFPFRRAPEPTPTVVPVPESWSVRYTAIMDDGAERVWDATYTFPTLDRFGFAGRTLEAQKIGVYAMVVNDTLYPPHRLRSVTWELL